MKIHNFACTALYRTKPLHSIFDIIDVYFQKYDSSKYVALFNSGEKRERMFGSLILIIQVHLKSVLIVAIVFLK